MELWKTVEEAPNYEISNYGNLRYKNKETNRKQSLSNGYVVYPVIVNKKRIVLIAHRLVAQYFLEPPAQYILEWAKTTKRNLAFVNHKDGDRTNNHYTNLEWCTGPENTQHAINNDQMSNSPRVGKISNGVGNGKCLSDDEIREIRSLFKPYDPEYGARALGKKYGVTGGYISNICNGTYRKNA